MVLWWKILGASSYSHIVWAVEGGNKKINVTTTGHATLTHYFLLFGQKNIKGNGKLISCALHLFIFFVFLGGRPTELLPISINGFLRCFLLRDGKDQRMGHNSNQLKTRLVLSRFLFFVFLLKTMAQWTKIPCQRAIVSARQMSGEDCRQAKFQNFSFHFLPPSSLWFILFLFFSPVISSFFYSLSLRNLYLYLVFLFDSSFFVFTCPIMTMYKTPFLIWK